jgi:SWI/SNF-related matrix-associated actin-dependent regulator 1 of chromatin subfamily A
LVAIQVLKDLPPKTDKVIECEMPPSQKQLYLETLRRSSSALAQQNLPEAERAEEKPKRGRKAVLEKKNDASANILMDLRKAALHPLLFRRIYDDKKIRQLARDCMIEPEFSTSNFDLIVEDMEVCDQPLLSRLVSGVVA